MSRRLAARTAMLMYQAAEVLQTTLVHQGHTFNHSHLVTAASLVARGHVDVAVDHRAFEAFAQAQALYYPAEREYSNPGSGEIEWLPGNTLYLRTWPVSSNKWKVWLAHEAVHIVSDIRAKPQARWDDEELAYFVDAFVEARLDESLLKRSVNALDYRLIACFASDFFNTDPAAGAVDSARFNRPMTFDYTAIGGRTGKANPYSVFTNSVRKAYPHGKIDGKKTEVAFDGINSFDPSKLPASVFQAYKLGAMAWPLVLEKALLAGIRNVDKLTDIVFFLHHPERYGRPLARDEGRLIAEWKGFRALVQPRV